MSEPFIAEVRIFAGNFAPRSWAFCDGQLLPIAQNTALFSLIGTTFGGDGRATTALPNLKGRAPMHPGRGPGLTPRSLGQAIGATIETVQESQMPSHNHTMRASASPSSAAVPSDTTSLGRSAGGLGYSSEAADVDMESQTLSTTGGGQAHTNVQPLLAMNFIIALQGVYPSRS